MKGFSNGVSCGCLSNTFGIGRISINRVLVARPHFYGIFSVQTKVTYDDSYTSAHFDTYGMFYCLVIHLKDNIAYTKQSHTSYYNHTKEATQLTFVITRVQFILSSSWEVFTVLAPTHIRAWHGVFSARTPDSTAPILCTFAVNQLQNCFWRRFLICPVDAQAAVNKIPPMAMGSWNFTRGL